MNGNKWFVFHLFAKQNHINIGADKIIISENGGNVEEHRFEGTFFLKLSHT